MAFLEIILKIVTIVISPLTEGLKTLLSNPISLFIIVLCGLFVYGLVNWTNIESITALVSSLCQ